MPNKQLGRYIQEQRQQGFSDQDIQEALKAAGWQDSQIAEAFAKSKPAAKGNKTPVKIKPLYLIIALVALALAVGAYFYGPTLMDMLNNTETKESMDQQGEGDADDEAGRSGDGDNANQASEVSGKYLITEFPVVKEEDNAYTVLTQLNEMFQAEGEKFNLYGSQMDWFVDDAGYYYPGRSMESSLVHNNANPEKVKANLEQRQAILDIYSQAAEKSAFSYPYVEFLNNYTEFWLNNIDSGKDQIRVPPDPSFDYVEDAALISINQAWYYAVKGDQQKALNEIFKTIKLGHTIQTSYLFVWQQEKAFGIKSMGLGALRALMRQYEFSEQEFRDIVKRLEEYRDNTEGYVKSLKTLITAQDKRMATIEQFKHPRDLWVYINNKSVSIDLYEARVDPATKADLETTLERVQNSNGMIRKDLYDYYEKHISLIIENIDKSYKAFDKIYEEVAAKAEDAPGSLKGLTIPGADPSFYYGNYDIHEKYEADLEVAATLTLAKIKIYEAARGFIPGSFEAMIPDYVDNIPLDPYDGERMKYHFDKKVFYSAGPDFEDGLADAKSYSGDDKYDVIFQMLPLKKPSFEELSNIFDLDKKNPDTVVYFMEDYGVGFTYLPDGGVRGLFTDGNQVTIELGYNPEMKIYINDMKNQSFEQAVKTALRDARHTGLIDCAYEENDYPDLGEKYHIYKQKTENEDCPKAGYLIWHEDRPDIFLYVISLPDEDDTPLVSDGAGNSWIESIRFNTD